MAAASARAIASLLRLAASTGRDARTLVAEDGLASAARLAALAAGWVVQAVAVSEVGWPAASGLDDIPVENPLRPSLESLVLAAPQPALRPNGLPPGTPTAQQLRRGLDQLDGVLAGLCKVFGVEPAADGPARSPGPVRPAPEPPPEPRPAAPAPGRIVVGAKPPRPPPVAAPVPPSAPIAPATRSGPVSSAAFWSLMDQWGVADIQALGLLDHPGGLTKNGARPRFKLAGAEADRYAALREIDSALRALGLDPRAWLARPASGAPFQGATPLAFLIGQGDARAVSRFVMQQGLRLSMAAGRSATPRG